MTIATAVDVTARLAQAKQISNLFDRFDDRGLDAYEKVAPILLDSLDAAEEGWQASLGYAVQALIELDAETGNWFDVEVQRQVQAQIATLAAQYSV